MLFYVIQLVIVEVLILLRFPIRFKMYMGIGIVTDQNLKRKCFVFSTQGSEQEAKAV